MNANYHTHTVRCHHAVGADREYIEQAILGGFDTLGFSDHCPQFYKDGFVSGMRMTPKEAEAYLTEIHRLAREYRDDIRIFAGFEAEYLPEYFQDLRTFCRDFGADYLIMGQHFLDRENGGIYAGAPTDNPETLRRYVDQVIEGLSTDCFTYLAHPDLLNFTGEDPVYEIQMQRLCRFCKEKNIPLEINMLGFADHRRYPSERFFRLAKQTGNATVIGCDAHDPASLSDRTTQQAVLDFARGLGLSPDNRISLRPIC